MIKIYPPNEKLFVNNGLGTIEPIKCIETKKISLNGWYVDVEASADYKDILVHDNICYVDTKEKGPQPFKINNPEVKGKKVSFTANHIIFDSSNYILEDVRPENLSPVAYLKWCNDRVDHSSPFTIGGTATGTATHYFVRKTLLEAFAQAEEDFDTLYDVDGFAIKIMDKSSVGTDQGFRIVYGKNLQEFKVVENWDAVCTRILPEGTNGLLLPEIYIDSEVQYAQIYTKVVNFDVPEQDDNENEISESDRIINLRRQATEYLKDSQYPQYSYELKSDVPQNLHINDVVYIKHPIFNLKANVQEYTYDCISKKVKTLTFGNYAADCKTAYQNAMNNIGESTEKELSRFQQIINEQTALINKKNKTGYLYLNENEMFILDQLPLEEAEEVWRFGLGGIGFSKTGYKGPFIYAFTQDGRFNTDFISAGSILTNMLEAEAITADKIAAGAITADKIDAKAVTADKIDAKAVTADKIAAGAITADKIAAGAITADKIDAKAITAEKLSADAITGKKINNGDSTFFVDESGNCTANSFNSTNANITGGRFNVSTDSAEDGSRMQLSYGSLSCFVSPSFICSTNGSTFGGVGCSEAGCGQVSAIGSSKLYVYKSYFSADGSMVCSGTKSRAALTDNYGIRKLYCYETPSPIFGDLGEGQIDDTGKCFIFLDDIFAETIDTDCTYQVFLQPYGYGNCYVSERTQSYFVVTGTNNLKFGWEIKAIQKSYDTMRLEEFAQNYSENTDSATDAYLYLESLLYDVERENA